MDTRERIVTECSQMLMSVGPASMTMDDVARACGISKRTLYETFPDKRTLISECIHREILSLPMSPVMTEAEVQRVIEVLNAYNIEASYSAL